MHSNNLLEVECYVRPVCYSSDSHIASFYFEFVSLIKTRFMPPEAISESDDMLTIDLDIRTLIS